jgi:hypothetical protein
MRNGGIVKPRKRPLRPPPPEQPPASDTPVVFAPLERINEIIDTMRRMMDYAELLERRIEELERRMNAGG